MKVGVFLLSENAAGGIHQYSQQILRSLDEFGQGHEFVALTTARNPELERYCGRGWTVVLLRSYWLLRKIKGWMPRSSRAAGGTSTGLGIRRWLGRNVVGKAAAKHGVDLIVFPSPCAEAGACGVPFVMTIHDIAHLTNPEFPEVSEGGEIARREAMYAAAAQATAVLVDSATSAGDIVERYGADRACVHPLPSVPPPYLARAVTEDQKAAVRRKYGLPAEYVFYPAQFWPHKNHLRLVEATAKVPGMGLVLGGSENVPFSTAPAVRERMAQLLPGRSWMLGYIPSEDMAPLYAASTMLVMPTFFGPTNIPIMEAFALGVPVVTSNLRGVPEQTGDAALLVDQTSVDAIAGAIERVRSDAGLRDQMIARGRRRAEGWTAENFGRKLAAVIQNCAARLGKAPAGLPPSPAGG